MSEATLYLIKVVAASGGLLSLCLVVSLVSRRKKKP